MAEQVFTNVNCGFFVSQDGDRLYTAEDMNRPYKRLVSNGVFATQDGTPSTDLQVLADSGRNISVAKGQGLFGGKWFENPAAIPITVPSNSTSNPRIDSVVVQVNTNTSVRAGRIIYRTGTAASNPVAPALNSGTGIVEYRLANVYVASQATAISQANITDCRGTSECPWVTSLVKQVDTSVLFSQWQSAFQDLYASMSAAATAYMSQAQASWDDFFNQLTTEISAVANVLTLQNSITATSGQTAFSIGIPSYDSTTDVLMVFINGLMARASMYSISGSTVTLTNALNAGDVVTFIVFKSLVTGDLSSVAGLISALDAKVDSVVSDSGWQEVALTQGLYGAIYCRKVGKQVYLKGDVDIPAFFTPADNIIATLTYRPSDKTGYSDTCFVGWFYNSIVGEDIDSFPVVLTMRHSDGQLTYGADEEIIQGYIVFSTSYLTDD